MEPMQEPDLDYAPPPRSRSMLPTNLEGAENLDIDIDAGVGKLIDDEYHPGEPIHLMKPSADHRTLVFDPRAVARIAAMGSVSVLSVVGNQRGGKSTLMNLLHGRQLHGFQTGHYMDPQTYGVWVRARPHPRRPGLTVLMVDTEGLDSPHVPQHYNWLISAVTLLMSDVFMYQTRGSIESSSAERLDMILQVAEQLSRGDGASGEQKACKTAFMWLLRDHQLQMKLSPKEEMEQKLEQGQLRALRRNFAEYDCVPLPRPARDDILKQIDRYQFQDLSQDFREEFVVFERRLFEILSRPRELFGTAVTGSGLVELLKQYLAAIERRRGILGDICQMPTQRELLKQVAAKRILEAGMKRYEEHMQEVHLQGPQARMPVAPAELLQEHMAARSAAIGSFESECGEACLEEEDVAVMRQQLDEKLAVWRTGHQVSTTGSALERNFEVECAMQQADMVAGGRMAPGMNQVSELSGGALWNLWQANARHSFAAYSGLLQRLSSLGAETLAHHADGANAEDAVATLYASLHGTLEEATKDPTLGPWAISLLGGDGREDEGLKLLLMGVAQQGDQLVAELLRITAERGVNELKDVMDEQQKYTEMRLEELQRSSKEAQDFLRSDIRDLESNTKDAVTEIMSTMTANKAEAKQELDDGLERIQVAMREALTQLEEKISKATKEMQDALSGQIATQAQASADESIRLEQLVRDAELRVQEAAASECRRLLETSDARAIDTLREAEERQRRYADEVAETCRVRSSDALQAAEVALKDVVAETSSHVSRLDDSFGASLRELREQLQEQAKLLETEVAAAVTASTAKLEERFSCEASAATSAASQALSFAESEAARLQAALDDQRHRESRQEDTLNATKDACDALRQEMASELATSRERERETEVRLEGICKQLLEDGSKRTLGLVRQALDVVEAQVLGERLAPIEKALQEVACDMDNFRNQLDQKNEADAKSDMNAIWESFAHLAAQLAGMQTTVDELAAASHIQPK